MCIISAKPRGVKMPNETTIKTMFANNSHGAGYMLLRKGSNEIVMSKGYENVVDYTIAVNELEVKDEDIFVMHFRIATSGLVNGAMCHPFEVTDNEDRLKATNIVSKRVCMTHNGIISDLNGKHKKYSDTHLFVRDYLAKPEIYNNLYTSEVIQELIEEFIDGSRLCFLHPKHGLLLLGNWQEDSCVLYSNKTFEPKTYKTSYYGGYNSYNWDKWSWEDNKDKTKSTYSKDDTKSKKKSKGVKNIDEKADGIKSRQDKDDKWAEGIKSRQDKAVELYNKRVDDINNRDKTYASTDVVLNERGYDVFGNAIKHTPETHAPNESMMCDYCGSFKNDVRQAPEYNSGVCGDCDADIFFNPRS